LQTILYKELTLCLLPLPVVCKQKHALIPLDGIRKRFSRALIPLDGIRLKPSFTQRQFVALIPLDVDPLFLLGMLDLPV
jgi:hypothetical protein